jgi:hypothetical protein
MIAKLELGFSLNIKMFFRYRLLWGIKLAF